MLERLAVRCLLLPWGSIEVLQEADTKTELHAKHPLGGPACEGEGREGAGAHGESLRVLMQVHCPRRENWKEE